MPSFLHIVAFVFGTGSEKTKEKRKEKPRRSLLYDAPLASGGVHLFNLSFCVFEVF